MKSTIIVNGREIPLVDQYGRPYFPTPGNKVNYYIASDESYAWVIIGNRKERRAYEAKERRGGK